MKPSIHGARSQKPRDPLDRYYTPSWCVEQGLDFLASVWGFSEAPDHILEPAAGKGVFVRALAERYPDSRIFAADMDPEADLSGAHGKAAGCDFLAASPFTPEPFGLIATNPPFRHAEAFARRALSLSQNTLFLVRQSFLSTVGRSKLFAQHPPTAVGLVPNRPSFTGDGATDMVDYCWVFWSSGRRTLHGTELIWLPPLSKEARA